MSDVGRQSLGEKALNEITPDSQKSFGEKTSEKVTGAYEEVAATIQPDSEKSTTQLLSDNTSSGINTAVDDGKGLVTTVQETAANIADAAGKNLKAAADYVAGNTETKPST